MLFPNAADSWLQSRVSISKSTRYSHSCNIKFLSKRFAQMKLAEIQLRHIRDYQAKRAAGKIPGLRAAGASAINRELSTLKQILDHAGEWDRLKKRYEPLRSGSSRVGRALADEEKTQQLFELAGQDTELARKLAACVVSHVSGAESMDRFLQRNVPEEVPQVWHDLAEQVMRALVLGRIAISRQESKLIQ
jgi:hypothetical protein